MSGQLPYEESDQQWNDIPMPDAEASWQKMEQLLDKENKRRRFVPPMGLQGCLGWSLLIIAAVALTWTLFKNNNTDKVSEKGKQLLAAPGSSLKVPTPVRPILPGSKPVPGRKMKEIFTKRGSFPNNVFQSGKYPSSFTTFAPLRKGKKEGYNKVVDENKQAVSLPADTKRQVIEKAEKLPLQNQDKVIVTDENTTTDSAGNNPLQANTLPQKKDLQKRFILSAGIGEQQIIPINGQTAVPYSYYGRKGSLRDYIPSLYLQLQKDTKWYLQAEFRYGAPQSVKEFSFNRKTAIDTMGMYLTTTTNRLKKTYYHQLPLSFNYFINPALSVGVGSIYSRFFAAVTEVEVKTQNLQTQAETVSRKIIPIDHFTDSFLYKTQVHLLLQADYHLRRVSFGLRYTRDLQPYIKFITPDGLIQEEKNQSLQFIARYRIWTSK